MDLFESLDNTPRNLLPQDGHVQYYGVIVSLNVANQYYQTLLNEIAWQHDEAIIMGKKITTKRKVAWYGDEAFSYTYSNITKTALEWTDDLIRLKTLVEEVSGERFNSCLLNLYHDGSEGMAWHSDAEKDLKKQGAIASVSFGAERKFAFKHKQTKATVYQLLQHGSLLIMKGTTQTHWQHRLPPTKTIHHPRINLTFRMIERRD